MLLDGNNAAFSAFKVVFAGRRTQLLRFRASDTTAAESARGFGFETDAPIPRGDPERKIYKQLDHGAPMKRCDTRQ